VFETCSRCEKWKTNFSMNTTTINKKRKIKGSLMRRGEVVDARMYRYSHKRTCGMQRIYLTCRPQAPTNTEKVRMQKLGLATSTFGGDVLGFGWKCGFEMYKSSDLYMYKMMLMQKRKQDAVWYIASVCKAKTRLWCKCKCRGKKMQGEGRPDQLMIIC